MLLTEKHLRNSSIAVTIILVISLLIFLNCASFKVYQTSKRSSHIRKEDIVRIQSLKSLTHLPYE
ncbi:hypothetical protein E0E04_07860 [Streptococcus vicugnae]|uniref:Uncharacterized protein n=1 Tax=Streptococcus vicugnae TaxID=2740579 RepID=A0A4R5G4P9_9STRE|nr:hypothetical protein E0E04_07860 [Streptococcus vicugnae]